VGGQPVYVFQSSRIDIGRCADVRDRRNRLVRTNHLVFADTDDALNQTVSRRHAHLDYQAAEGAFRVYDDGSEQGTSVARGGRAIAVPPGPRGVRLKNLDRLKNGVAPAGWHHDKSAWWLEEHGLLMEAPSFPMPAGVYVVTGDREVTSVLTVHPASTDGRQRWELADGATLCDVTHLRCRSAVYTPAKAGASCSPTAAREADFPVSPGAAMPPVPDCAKQDYEVLIVIAKPKAA